MAALGRNLVCLIFGSALISRYTNIIIYLLPCQAPVYSGGYDHLEGKWPTYYKVASRFTDRVKAEDKEDILHTIIMTLADVERNNGHKPFTEAVMYRIASRTVADYWRTYYKANNGLECGSCSRKQRSKCRSEDLYRECPKAIKLESLNQPIIGSEGLTTELGELIADDKALDLHAWVDCQDFPVSLPAKANGDSSQAGQWRGSHSIR